jgi:hypothetical protein
MRILVFCLLVILITPALGQEQLPQVLPLKSSWIFTFAGEQGRYHIPWNYTPPTGATNLKSYSPDSRTFTGGRLGFGREFNPFGGLLMATKLEAYYMGTLFTSAQTASPEVDLDISSAKRSGQLAGADLVQTLGYSFPFSMRDLFFRQMTAMRFEPFAEVGLGRAWAFNKLQYSDQRGPSYEHTFRDVLSNMRMGFGFNLVSNQNYFMFVRASVNNYSITDRRIHRQTQAGVDPTVTQTDAEMAPIMIYSLGGGLKF